jgi:uncharacterized protein with HEPN domain
MMAVDKSLLLNILDRTKDISRFISGCDQDSFMENDEKQNAVVMCLLRIGENANKLSAGFIAANSQVLWRPIINLRHIAAHKYDSLQMLDVWVNATKDVPILRAKVEYILESELP